jgi:hypothetical protein
MFYNVMLADPISNLGGCCFLGYHGASNFLPIQTYSPSDFDTAGLFGPTQRDAKTLSHEVGEWVDDPFGNNPTPAWGNSVGQVPPGVCQSNLEVGDPLRGTNFSAIAGHNGFTYHLQELAFFVVLCIAFGRNPRVVFRQCHVPDRCWAGLRGTCWLGGKSSAIRSLVRFKTAVPLQTRLQAAESGGLQPVWDGVSVIGAP